MLHKARFVFLILVATAPVASLAASTPAEAQRMIIRPGMGGWHGGMGGWHGGGWHGGWGGGGWGGCGWGGCGWGAPFAAGVAGSLLGAALVAPAYGYGYGYPYGGYGYGYPYGASYASSSCYWRQRVYDVHGHLIGRHVRICH